tara:strand:+ start:8468 stop:8578 length:111 start_codon:yes stop_codon:yes gene_type:complete
MSNVFKPIAALLVGTAILGAAATGVAIPIGIIAYLF